MSPKIIESSDQLPEPDQDDLTQGAEPGLEPEPPDIHDAGPLDPGDE